MAALTAEPKSLTAPLQLSDTDAALLADRAKLAAAARQLEGRQVKLLPDERWDCCCCWRVHVTTSDHTVTVSYCTPAAAAQLGLTRTGAMQPKHARNCHDTRLLVCSSGTCFYASDAYV